MANDNRSCPNKNNNGYRDKYIKTTNTNYVIKISFQPRSHTHTHTNTNTNKQTNKHANTQTTTEKKIHTCMNNNRKKNPHMHAKTHKHPALYLDPRMEKNKIK